MARSDQVTPYRRKPAGEVWDVRGVIEGRYPLDPADSVSDFFDAIAFFVKKLQADRDRLLAANEKAIARLESFRCEIDELRARHGVR